MEFSYYMGEFRYPNYVFVLNDGRYLNIDLANDYPNYRMPLGNLGNEQWHCTVIKILGNTDLSLGDIRLVDRSYIRKIATTCKSFFKDNVIFRKSTQTELDKYESKKFPISDNGKVYLYIYNILEEEAERGRQEQEQEKRLKQSTINSRIKVTIV